MKIHPASVRDLFLQVSTIDSRESQARFLNEACAGEPELRREVESMLSEQDALGDFLESPAMKDTAGTHGSHITSVGVRAEKSDTIGPYKLLQEIGEGGCGVVYLAEQETPVRRRVALKVIKLGMDTKSVIARFESERQALALMDHPNIAKVLDAGTTGLGRPYFVMELVRGVRITEYCNEHKLTVEERLKLFIQVSQAIQHAHQKGIIHRDIKPSNILVSWINGVPVPKIIDFGIAKATEQRLTDKTLFTEVQAFMGTPAYMSPEQAEMRGLDIDTRSDIYALGVLLYELLVGKTPFDAAALRDQGVDGCRQTIREVEPMRPSQRVSTMADQERVPTAEERRLEPSRLVHTLRGDLDWIVMKCLEKERQRRYATASALAEDVQHYLDGDLVTARPPSTLYRLQKTMKRHRLAVSAAALMLLILTAAAFLSTWQALRATRAEQAASAAREEQQRLRLEAEGDREQAESNAARARMNEYVAEMNLAYQALRDGNLGRAFQLVSKHGAAPESEDLRGFAWRYLRELCEGDEHLSFPNQDTPVRVLAYSPDGELLAVGGREELLLWDVQTQTRIIQLPVAPHALVFAPNGRTLYTAGRDGVYAWDTATWTSQAGPTDRAESLALSPDGRRLLVGTRRRVVLYDTTTWDRLWELPEASAPVAFSHDGERFVTDSNAGLRVWETTTARPLVLLDDSQRLSLFSQSVVFTRDNTHVIAPRNTSSTRGMFVLSLWETSTGNEVGTLPADASDSISHTGGIFSISLSPDGNSLATASMDHSVGLWDLNSRRATTIFRGHRHEVWALAFSPRGDAIAAGGKDGSLFIWPNEAPLRENVISGQGESLGISPDGTQLACLLREPAILRIFDLRTHTPVRSLPLIQPQTPSESLTVTVSYDFSSALQVTGEGTFHLWDLASGRSHQLTLDEASARDAVLSPNGQQVLIEQRHGRASWWGLQESLVEKTPVLRQELEKMSAARFSEDGNILVTLNHDNEVRVWDAQSAQELRRFLVRAGGRGLALSPDGSILATTGSWFESENSIWLWSTADGTQVSELDGHKQSVASVAFSPDGKTLASSSYDSSLKLWHLATGQELVSIRKIGTTLHGLRFSGDGEWLAANAGSPFSVYEEIHLFHAPQN